MRRLAKRRASVLSFFKRYGILCICIIVGLILINNWNFIRFFFRPIWDVANRPKPWNKIPFRGFEGKETCELYGWKARDYTPKVVDTFLFNNELDLLEIRLHELNNSVDLFVLVEGAISFTGKAKTAHFLENKNSSAFAPFLPKIKHIVITDPKEFEGKGVFGKENWQRYMAWLRGAAEFMTDGDLIIHSDVDEIPRAEAVELFKHCAFEETSNPMHLIMTRYHFSFEFPIGVDNVAAIWYHQKDDSRDKMSHRRQSDYGLADSGWHCTFCFRYIEDFVFKMETYAHWDRASSSSKQHDAIQKKVCSGVDIFGEYPEVFTWREVFRFCFPPEPSLTVTGLPAYLTHNPHKFAHLIPGNCHRKSKFSKLNTG